MDFYENNLIICYTTVKEKTVGKYFQNLKERSEALYKYNEKYKGER